MSPAAAAAAVAVAAAAVAAAAVAAAAGSRGATLSQREQQQQQQIAPADTPQLGTFLLVPWDHVAAAVKETHENLQRPKGRPLHKKETLAVAVAVAVAAAAVGLHVLGGQELP